MLKKHGHGRYLIKRYLAERGGLPEFINYQKKEGRSIMPSTVDAFKQMIKSGQLENEFRDLPFASYLNHKTENRQAGNLASAYMLKHYLDSTP